VRAAYPAHMPYETTVQKIGDRLGIVLPSEVLKRLDASEGDIILLGEGSEGCQLTKGVGPSIDEVMKSVASRYSNALAALAKGE
jgi:hypothetical protein